MNEQYPSNNTTFAACIEDVVRELGIGATDPVRSDSNLRRGRLASARADVIPVTFVESDDDVVRIVDGIVSQSPVASGRRNRLASSVRRTITTVQLSRLEASQVYSALEIADLKLTPEIRQDSAGGATGLRSYKNGTWVRTDTFPVSSGQSALLLIHGTFSNCDTLVEGMQSTQAGQKFLADAAKKYDAILAFDHRTLGVSPMINARELALLTNRSRASIDIVCHSRGGLVARWWAEAFDQVRGRRRRIMFVGSPLAGTGLAAPPNIRKTMNLLASLAKAVGMGTAAVPFLTVVSILSQISGSITSIVARTPVVDATVALVPGLDAMSRVGNNHELLSIRRDPAAADSYFAVTSNFESEKVGWRFWKVFKGPGIRLLDLGADVIFSGPNDLVVDTESMTSLADEITMKMENVLDFGTTDTVYHTNYFQQKATMDFLARILLN